MHNSTLCKEISTGTHVVCYPGAGIRGSFAPLPVSFVRASHQSHVSARSQTPEELDTVGPLQLEDSSALEAGDEGEEEGLDDRFMATLVRRQQQWQTDIPAGERRVAARVRQVSDFWCFFYQFFLQFFSFSRFFPGFPSAAASSAVAVHVHWNHIPDVQGHQSWTGVHTGSGSCLMPRPVRWCQDT